MSVVEWYAQLLKPEWAPPAWIFRPVWLVLYAIIGVTCSVVFAKVMTKDWPWRVALPFALNLLFNFIFVSIQFGLQDNLLAALDVMLVLGTLIWAMVVVWPRARWIAYANVPYLLWVLFATMLQFAITFLNW